MLRSMTGYASASGASEGWTWRWEMRGVNGRGRDVRLRLPDWIDGLDVAVRPLVEASVGRGSVQANLRVESSVAVTGEDQIAAAIERIRAVEAAARVQGLGLAPCRATDILGLRAEPHGGGDMEDAPALRDAVLMHLRTDILPEFQASREAEGRALAAILGQRIDAIAEAVTRAGRAAEDRIPRQRSAMEEALERLTKDAAAVPPDRLAQELALVAMRQDVTEELDRLAAHVEAARGHLVSDAPVGRKLDFLMQEFMREANTLGSKSQDGGLTAVALDLKVLVDQMREQVQNVE